MPYRLRYKAHDLELPIGEFVVGRSTDCQLSLDDPLVSRRHAAMRVRPERVTVRDLGSRNGVLVNGTRIEGERELAAGDKVSIGGQDMIFQVTDDAPATLGLDDNYRRATQTLGAAYVSDIRAAVEASGSSLPPPNEATKSMQSFKLLGGVAEKALAMNRAEEAERLLQTLLLDVLNRAREGQPVEASVAEVSSRYACRLASALGRGSWVDYVVELYTHVNKPMPAPIVDELYVVVRKVKTVDLVKIRAYVALLKKGAASFGPTDRFLLQRAEGLERLVALR
jgi:predicted component of type VI protein secretion system